MTRIEMGNIDDEHEAFLITKGFEYQYEVAEEDVSNTYDNLPDFANAVLLAKNAMGYYRLKMIAMELLKKLAEENRDEAIRFCKEDLYMQDFELEFLGGDEL